GSDVCSSDLAAAETTASWGAAAARGHWPDGLGSGWARGAGPARCESAAEFSESTARRSPGWSVPGPRPPEQETSSEQPDAAQRPLHHFIDRFGEIGRAHV